jgi:hypothetical protein
MKPSPARLASSPEALGLISGLLMLFSWKLVPLFLAAPGIGLLALVICGGVAGVIGAASGTRQGASRREAVRIGTRASVWAVLAGAACFVLMARLIPGLFAPWKALLIAGASALPAMFAGSIGATIAMLASQRNSPAQTEATPVAQLSAGGTWALRVLMIGLSGAGVVAPLFPTPIPPPPPPPPPPPKAPEPKSAEPSVPPPFTYTTPEALKSAPPIAWRVLTERNLGEMNTSAGVELSADQTVVVAMRGNAAVVAQNLVKEESPRVVRTPLPIKWLALSPDAKQVFVVLTGDPLRVGVVDLESQRYIALPQPKQHAIADGRIVWWKQKQVLFLTSDTERWGLDLDSLEFAPADLTEDEADLIAAKFSPPLPGTAAWQFFRESFNLISAELPETKGIPNWPWSGREVLRLADKVHRNSRLFPQINTTSEDFLLGVADGSKLLRFSNGELQVFYMDTRPLPPMRWRLTMPHGPEKMRETDTITSALTMGDLSLVLYSPLTNPLTRKTIGPNREQPKSLLRFSKWEGTEAEVFIATDNLSYTPGDVLADVHVISNGREPRLLSLNTPHRWWMIAPEPLPDARDISKMPTVAENEKRRDQATAAVAKNQEQKTPPVTAATKPVNTNPSAFAPDGQLTPVEYTRGITNDDLTRVLEFLESHHEKASRGQIKEMVQDYADVFDYFTEKATTREKVYGTEMKYHAGFESVTETVRRDTVQLAARRPNGLDVSYLLDSVRQLKGGKTERGTYRVRLWIVDASSTFRIRSHKAEVAR